MATLKKPKKNKYPKKPKANASVPSMNAYLEKVKAIDTKFDTDSKGYAKECKARKELKDKISKVAR